MRRISILVVATALTVGSLAAQGGGGTNLRLAQGQDARYVPPLCPLRTGGGKVDKGVASLRKAYDAKLPADRTAQLTDAKQNLLAAITQDAQATNGAAWYFLARVALMQGDPAGADSAFTKAQELAPLCEIDITQYRQKGWALLGQAGIEMQRKGETDSALVQFRDASRLFRGLPHVYSNMGVVFANNGHDDSAAVYFEKALAIAEKDTSLVEDRNSSASNMAIMYQRLKRNGEAIAILHKYLSWNPGDTDAQKTLAVVFRNAGMVDSAEAVERAMIARFSKMNLDSLDTGDLLSVGVAAFNNQKYPEAEAAFGKAVQRNPWSRDARYNMAITHLAVAKQASDSAAALRKLAKASRPLTEPPKTQVADTVKLDAVALVADSGLVSEGSRLLEIEPMNEDALRLLAQGQRSLKQDQAVLKTAERLVALPFTVEVSLFQVGKSSAKLVAEATGRTPQDAAGKPLKVAPITLAVEFIDLKGTVIATQDVSVPVLTTGQKHPIQVEGKGEGITGWRYRVKPS